MDIGDWPASKSLNAIWREIFPGQFARCPTVAGIVRSNCIYAGECLLMIGILKQTDPDRAKFIETRAHGDYWPAGREIADAPIAKPPAVGPNINILRYGEFAARAGNEITVGPHIR